MTNDEVMNIEHRTSNIEHRIMYSVYFKPTERSDSTPPAADQSTFVIPLSFTQGVRIRRCDSLTPET